MEIVQATGSARHVMVEYLKAGSAFWEAGQFYIKMPFDARLDPTGQVDGVHALDLNNGELRKFPRSAIVIPLNAYVQLT